MSFTINLILGLSFFMAINGFGQGTIVYDNQILTVNDGRVNDPDFPVFLMHADSFSLSGDATVNRVSWLGAYKGGNNLPDGNDNFTLNFFNFNNDTPALSPFATFVPGAVQRNLTSQSLIYGQRVFSYSATFPDLHLVVGTYLMAIMNNSADNDQWLWACMNAIPGESYMMLNAGTSWQKGSGNGVAEFAFSLSNVPEPSEVVLLLLGILCLGIISFRSCRATLA